MKVLVTGGSGYLGIHVRRFFHADDFSRRSHLDILNTHDAALAANYNVVIHLAAHLDKSAESAETSFRTNAEGTANLLRHMLPNSIFIYASTKDVYGSWAESYTEVPETCSTDYCGQSVLEWSKLMGEKYVEYYSALRGIRSCIFRLSTVYARPSEDNEPGFVTHYVESTKRGLPIALPLGGRPIRDIMHVDDFSRACRAFIDSSLARGLYNLGGGGKNKASLREIVDRVGRMIDLEPVISTDENIPAPVPMNYVSDISLVESELGWKPDVGIDEGLRSLL
jgi:nucleoside-diphosphate-sugar epimerase